MATSMLVLALSGAFLVSASFAADQTTASLVAGGGRSAGGAYINEGCIGGLAGVAVGERAVARHGFAGQLVEVCGLSVSSVQGQVAEAATAQLCGAAILDDDSTTLLNGGEIAWDLPAWPLAGIDANGAATAAIIYADTRATVGGTYAGVPGTGSLLVVDTSPDNFGSYAFDGLPDAWQVGNFGFDHAAAGPEDDPDGDGQNNRFEHVAGVEPTNAASRFVLRIATVPGQPGERRLIFGPRWSDRAYTPEFRTNLAAGAGWQTLETTTVSDDGTERTVTDLDANAPAKFYQVGIAHP